MAAKIRPMKPADVDRVYEIELSTHLAPWSRDILSDCVSVGYDCRVIEVKLRGKKRILGYIISRYSFNICHILNLCIASSAQRKGLGKLLLRDLLNSINKTVVKSVILEVRPSNPAALSLYEKFGFQQDSIKPGYYKDIKGEEDAILLKKTFP